jgi:hypothetical protein
MKLEVVRVNEDGSADATVEFGPGELEAFARIGIIASLEAAIKSEKAKAPNLDWPPVEDETLQDEP